MRLLGRDVEIAAVARALAEAEAGGWRLLALSGEAGIGKSALLAVAAERARDAGLQVLSARASEQGQELPFGVVRDALGERLEPLPAPAPGEPVIPWERFRLHHALRAQLEAIAVERPLALLLDDMQWADEATIELLLHLLRRPPRGVLLLFALRPGTVLTRLVDAGRRADGWDELRPAPLSRRTARALLPPELDDDVRERILHEADGNPLFLRELARGTGAAGDPDEPVPGTIAAAIAQELDRLSPGAHLLADGAAIAGDPFDLDVATAAAAVDEPAALAALDELVAADLVRAAGGRSFGFRHPLVHRAVADATDLAWRLEAHARAAALLAERGAAPSLRAYHVEQFAQPGDGDAIALFRAAGEEAAVTAPSASADWYGAALALAPADDAPLRAALLERQGLALGAAGRYADSSDALDACIELLPADDLARRVTLVAAVATADVLRGDYDDAERRIGAVLADAPPELRPRLLSNRAGIAFLKGDSAAVAGWAERAEQALDRLPADQQLAARSAIASQQAFGQVLLGEPAGGRVEQAARLLEPIGDEALANEVDVAWTVGGNLSQVERYAAAAPVLRRGLRLARNSLQAHLYLHLHVVLAMAELPLLELDAALERLDVAEEATRLQGRRYELAFALTQKARVLAACGRQEEAEQAAFDSELLIGGSRAQGATVTLLAHNALVRHARDPRRLLRELTQAAGRRLQRLNRTAAGSVLLAATRAAIAAELLDDAAAWAGQASAVAGRLDLPATAVRAVRAEGELLLARGDAEGAVRLARGAVAEALRHGLRQEQLGADLLAGRALLVAGEREAGVARLQAVAATAGRLGAFADRDEAARALRQAGARLSMSSQRAADAAGRSALSEREQAVAELVARGASNRQVAAELHLSEKTVERHLSRVYAKLAVDDRGELAALLAPGA